MDPRDFHQLASHLVRSSSAAEIRTAISRAYYAVYHVSAEILRAMGFQISTGPQGHGDVRNRLSNSGAPEVMRIGSQLGDLQGRRIQADYRLDNLEVENPKTAHALVEQAARMIQTLERCSKGLQRPQIIAAIEAWEQKIGTKPPTRPNLPL